jgi:hypothetical protein
VYLIRGYAYTVNGTGHTVITELTVDGAAQSLNPVNGGSASQSITISGEWRITGLSAGSHTFIFRARMAAAGQTGTIAGGGNSKLIVERQG